MRRHNILLWKKKFPKMSVNACFLELSEKFLGTQNWVRISHGKQIIGVRVIEVLLYKEDKMCQWNPFRKCSAKPNAGKMAPYSNLTWMLQEACTSWLWHFPGIFIYILCLTLVLLNPDIPDLCKQRRSRSVGFWRSQLIWICTVCH